jgi:hypothetical protein
VSDFELDLDLKSNFLSDFGLDLDLKSNSESDFGLDLDLKSNAESDFGLDLDLKSRTLVGLGLLARKPDFGKVRGRGIGLWFWTWTSCASLGRRGLILDDCPRCFANVTPYVLLVTLLLDVS